MIEALYIIIIKEFNSNSLKQTLIPNPIFNSRILILNSLNFFSHNLKISKLLKKSLT